MSDRYKGFVVTLDADMRRDDAESIIEAIGTIKGVASVNPVLADINDMIIRQRIKAKMYGYLLEAMAKS